MSDGCVSQPDRDRWDEFIHWARRMHEWDQFDATERDYKLAVGETISKARSALLRGDEWLPLLERAFTQEQNNLVHWMARDNFLKWAKAHREEATDAIALLWNRDVPGTDVLAAFFPSVGFWDETKTPQGNRVALAAFLMMGIDPTQYPPYRPSVFQRGFTLTGYPPQPYGPVYPEICLHALGFLDRIIDEASQRDFQLRDRLDAQSVLYAVIKWGSRWGPSLEWPESEREAYQRYIAKPNTSSPALSAPTIDDAQLGEPTLPSETIQQLAERLLLDVTSLRDIQQLLEDKRQVIFFGPPGTGKTFVARELARLFVGDPDAYDDAGEMRLVQFHPSYAYEDFVQGYRPHENGFALRDGPLLRIAEAARNKPDATHVLVIDEINRGNIAKVFGELYFLLEYRGETIGLQYSDKLFELPKNLWVIATMNTADRSIALIDAALRRRFHFVPFFPDEEPIEGLLRRWLQREKPHLEWVADRVDEANHRLDDRHASIGPSHFMKDNLDDKWVELIWKHSILPYIGEHFFGQDNQLNGFSLAALAGSQAPFNDLEDGTHANTDAD